MQRCHKRVFVESFNTPFRSTDKRNLCPDPDNKDILGEQQHYKGGHRWEERVLPYQGRQQKHRE